MCKAGVASPSSKSGAMKILYVNPRHDPGSATEFLKRAVLIAEKVEDSAAFEFISKVHRQQAELLVLQFRLGLRAGGDSRIVGIDGEGRRFA